jgi:type III secretion protein S
MALDIPTVTSEALLLTLMLSMPPIVIATIVGVLVSLVQAMTQIQEQTLSFAIKLICVSLVILGTAHWLGGELYRYTLRIFDALAAVR